MLPTTSMLDKLWKAASLNAPQAWCPFAALVDIWGKSTAHAIYSERGLDERQAILLKR